MLRRGRRDTSGTAAEQRKGPPGRDLDDAVVQRHDVDVPLIDVDSFCSGGFALQHPLIMVRSRMTTVHPYSIVALCVPPSSLTPRRRVSRQICYFGDG